MTVHISTRTPESYELLNNREFFVKGKESILNDRYYGFNLAKLKVSRIKGMEMIVKYDLDIQTMEMDLTMATIELKRSVKPDQGNLF